MEHMEHKVTHTIVTKTVKHTVTQSISSSESNGDSRVIQSHETSTKAITSNKATSSIAGFFVEHIKEKVSIYQALLNNLVSDDVALALLEAQAATGNIMDITKNQLVSVEAAIEQGLASPEHKQKLIAAHNAVTGYKYKDETLSLFHAFKKGLIDKYDAIRFLEAQVATGGIIDHVSGHRMSLSEALKHNGIDEEMFKILSETTESTKRYTDPNTQEDSTYQQLLAKCIIDTEIRLPLLPLQDSLQGLRKPVTLEQLFNAKIIDQTTYDEIKQGKQTLKIVGERQEVQQYLLGSKIIGGVYIQSTKERMNIYQAMKQNFLTSDTAVALLEAQAATGFLIDAVSNAKLSVTEAIQKGLVGLELKEKLLTAERSVLGFNDPYTGKRISLFQAIKKELIEKNQGLNLLEVLVATGGIIDPVGSFRVPVSVAYKRGLFDKEMDQLISDSVNGPTGFLDPNTDEHVTYLELQKRCMLEPDTKLYLLPLVITFQGLRGNVTSEELLDSLIIDKTSYEDLQHGNISVQEVAERETVQQYLEGTGCIAGIAIISTNDRKSIYQAMKEHMLLPGTSMALLEAQAATGYLVDPVKNVKFSVDDAVKHGLIGPEVHEKLLSAERAVIGYKDPYTGDKLSLFQAIKKDFIAKDHGISLLEAQIATGGIIDPVKKHRVPEEIAYKRGYFDKEMNNILKNASDETKFFFDPNSKENVTYAQLLKRCVIDFHSGLYLIPLFDNTQDELKTPHTFIDYQIQVTLKEIKITLESGKYKGQTISLWKLLFSDYFTAEQRESLIKLYKTGNLSIEELSSKITTDIKQLVSTTKVTFKGLRENVTPGQLLNSEIINKDLYEKLEQGKTSAKDVVNIESVRKYLQGTESISGLILTENQEKISIYQAKRKGILRPGTSLILLEAQAATGFVIDPVENKKYSVDEALKANVIGPEFYEKLLSAEKSVTGYHDPYTEEIISLFQAMNKELIVKDHGIRLLEAQIATGGIIDPINSHRIPVEVAYKRGYFDKKMHAILSDPSDDTKGFFDPNTNENLTYLQLKEKCITEPSTNLCLLPLHSKKFTFQINDYVRDSFRNLEIHVKYGRFRGQTVSAWVLINSEYFSEWKRRELIEMYRLRKATLEQITLLIQEEMKKWAEITFPAIRGDTNIYHLLEAEIIDKDLFEQVLDGKIGAEDILKMETVQKHLHGSGVLGGIIIQPSNQKINFYEAAKKNILLPSTVLPLLEAQAASGYIIDPVTNQKLSVDEALKAGVISPQVYDKLRVAEEAVTGYKDPYTGNKISLFQAMQKGLVEENHATQLLEAQLATGGIIDPVNTFHLPDKVAYKYGYFNEEMHKRLLNPTDSTKLYYDPTTKEMVTYSELISRSEEDKSTGIHLLPVPQEFVEVPLNNIYSDEEVRQAFKSTKIEERNMTLWDLVHSGYFTEEQRYHILEKYKSKKATIQELTIEILQIVRDNEIKVTTHISFEGIRGKVPAVNLLELGIISQQTFDDLVQGKTTIEEVSKINIVKKCLEGTGCISGVFLQPTKEKMSIYQAIKRNLILPANGLMLLEAQAATGFMIDPTKNQKYSVDSAVKASVIGPELHEKLLTAESALTGYTDPYTGNKISLGQAITKQLIANKDGIPLLQAQIAAGGIIDPIHKYYVPIKLAFKLGFIDEDVSKATENLKVYFDPNTKKNLTYLQLKETCFKDIETGHLLLSISENPTIYAESHIIEMLKSVNINVQVGRFKGQTLSVWDLLNSEYITMNKFKELLSMYTNGSSAVLQDIVKIVSTIIEETSTTSKKIKFKGLRKQVSASDLFESNVIDKKTLDELNQGKKTITEVTEMDNVKRYLQGTNCISGILIQSTNKKMSIYEAMLKRILRPGTALVLLEAQAATGYIIDPVKNQKLSVDEAMAQGLIGHDIYNKLLSAEQAVTGYTDPYTGEKISLFQALNKNLIVDCHAIRLLEAQIATGGIIDPVHSHRVPVEVAYKRGYFNEEMNKILSDPSDDTKGFFDPNTHENLTYLQLVDRCIQDPETGLYLLQVVKKGENYFYITDKMKEDLRSKTIQMQFGLFANQTVSIWEILCSQYITELKRRELVKLYAMGVLTIEQLISTITTLMHEFENKSSNLKFKGIRAEVTATDLFNAEVIDKKILDDLKEGKTTVDTVAQMDSVKRYLEGTSCIAGIVVSPSNETVSISEAMGRGILARDVGLLLLQAQVATGFLIDPTTNKRFSVAEALSAGLINSDVQGQLEIAEKSVTGFTDPMTNSKISLFQAIKKNIVAKEPSIYLLEAQMATGGIFDPIYSHRLPLEVAYKKHYLDEDTYILVSDDDGKKGFVDPNTHQKITYKHLIERCTKDPKTGMHLLQIAEKRDDYFYVDEPTKHILMSVVIKMSLGRFQGQEVSLWELLCSEYISEEKRKELIKKYKTDTTSILKDIINIILSIIQEKETNQKDIWFQGLRKQITASELYEAEIISKDTLEKLRQGMETASDVAKTDSVKRYLEGTSCIAGIFVNAKKDPSQRKKMQIYEAMIRNILRPGTALVLLEAQAATGFVIDCIKNKKYSVEEALSAGLIGYEIYNKLLSAERGVTGYTDPYTGEKISLFQAMQKDLIVKEHGIRLLEAQIATGGIIDPVHSHRVPVEVAYKRGYFDEEMNQILSDPSDDTKGFFDPNTHENLTYMQLFQRCIQDPDTGLYMLEVTDKKSSQQTETQTILKSKTVQITVGEFQGKNVTFWELLHSKYISVEKREELLKKYRHGDLSLEELLTIITTIITQTEISQLDATDSYNHNELIQSQLQSQKVKINIGDFNGQTVTLWELLNSHYITEEKQKEVLEKLKSGTLTIQEIVTTITTIITEAELKKSEQIEQSKVLANEQTKTAEHSLHANEIQKALQSISIPINKGQFQAQEISVWDFLNSRYVKKEKRQELLGNYKLTIQDIIAIVIKTLEVDSKLSEKYNVLKTNQVEVSVGELKGQKMSVWDLLTSRYISEEKKVELLENLNSGKSDVKELIKIVSTIIEETEERSKKLKFKGLRRQVTATELLTSEIIDQKTLTELTQGKRTIDEVTKMDKVKRYLEGTSSIAGVLVPSIRDPSKIEKMSIYDAMQKRILRPGTALVLLEAQAATGFVIDPIKNKKLSVDEAVTASLVGQELHGKLLSAEKAVTGYKDPYTGDKISLFQAMQKDLIVKDHGIRLLEAQIATGGIIDPVHSHRVPVEVAYKRGYFDEEMNQILSDPSDDTKGFFDPNTHENLTYMQLLERCNKDPSTGLYMLEVRHSKPSYFQIDKKIESTLQSKTIYIKVGRYTGQNISIWELLNSQYVLEKRLDLLKKYQSGSITIEELIQIITTIIEETENKTSFGDVNGSITDQSEQNKDAVQTTKQNQQTILQSHLLSITKGKLQGQKISLWDLLNSAYITEVKKHELLQKYTAGTLTLEDMIQIIITLISQTDEKTVTIEQKEFETTNTSLQLNISTHTDEQLKKALSAIKVSVQPGQFQEQRVSLWEVLNSKYIPAKERDVQLKKHQTSVKELKQVITDLVEVEEAKSDQEIQNALEKKTAEVAVGEFKGQSVSLWVLLHSKYVSEEKRKELLEKYKHGELTEEEILRIIIKIIEEIEERSRNLKFKGLRRQITATELLQSEIIDQSTMNELTQGSRTVEQVTQMDSVKRYLEGTSCIAGVFVTSKKDPSKREKINIYEAMLNRILRPGSALILLEAQAATGFVIDSIQNKKLSVDEALSAGLIGYEIYNKLLSAEKGVTGYTDPYSGEKISLFQAMQKDLIVKEHGIRLLEAQIATGGIIDPVHSHRVPVEVAYKRGYFDEEMNQILSDPSDDTKGFFDPNTHENLTYMQLLQRCIQDPGTGLYMLDVKDSKSFFHQTDLKSTLKSKNIQITTGQFQGKNISIWELLNSKYISEEKREELLKKYRTGTLSMEELITIVTTIITETEDSTVDSTESFNHNEQIHTLLQSQKIDVSVGDFKGQCVTLWELLNSRYIAKEQRNEILEKMKVGTLSIQEVITLIITIITESELKRIEQIQQFNQVSAEQSKTSDHSIYEDEIKKALQSISIHIKKGQFQGQEISVWDLLQTSYITEEKRQELLGNYKLTVQDIITIVIKSVDEVENQNSSFKTEYKLNDDIYNNLKTVQVEISVGEYKGKKMLLWDLLMTSKYISEEKKVELFKKLNSGKLDTNELIKVIITIIEETEEKSKKLKFKGLRRQVTATELLTSEIIDQKTLTELTQGKKTVEEVTQMDTVKRYLEGTSCIAGVLVPSIKHPSKIEKMSIYDAKLKRVLRPGTALVLLEAQAATGFVIDPIKNKKLSVDEAVTASLVGQELHGKLLSAEKAVTGYKDPYTGDKISLFQAMQKDLIVKDHGIRLLEAQIATGGIIDPVHSHRVPVEVAYKRGYFDEKMNQILSDPSDDTKGFFDPNTHENLTYMQLLERCIKDPDTGLYMLDVKNSKPPYFQIDKKIESTLQSKTIHINVGKYTGQNISVWKLLNSQYLLEKRLDLLKKYQSGSITIEELIQIITTIIEETENKTSFGDVNGSITDQSQQNKDAVQTTKQNQQTILQSHLVSITKGKLQGQKISLWDLLNSAYITEDKKHELLQKYTAGTLTLEDMIQIIITLISQTDEKTVTIEQKEFETTNNSLQLNISTHTDEQLKKALSAIKVSVQPGQFQEQRVSLWEVLNSKYIPAKERDVQLKKHQTSVKELKQVITDLVEVEEAKSDQEIQNALEKKTAEVAVGEFKGQSVSLWVLLHSKYVSEEKRKELLEKYKHGELTEEEILRIIIKIIEEIEERSRNLKFKGLRRQITATELLQSEIIDQSTMNELTQGSRTVEQVTQMDSVKRYLEGTSCIAGVFVTSKKDPSKREKINIYEAMLNRILRPGSALILLEAQAATGFVIDSIQNKKLSVDEALSAGLIGYEIYNKLLSAEKGVTGYTDPYSGEKISLFQAMQKDLIVKEHGIRLLEAQIATGGIIDPVHSHRVPVEVAYKRGYFDEEMNQILSDPSDDTKGFFDPNTHENLTYMQLLQRCIQDPGTGLYMLDVKDSKSSFHQTDIQSTLKSKIIQITTGQFQGKNISIWELLNSKYISEEKREELLKKYRTGTLSMDELITIVTTIITETEVSQVDSTEYFNHNEQIHTLLQSQKIDVSVGDFKGQCVTLWELLNSRYIAKEQRNEILEKMKVGTLSIQEVITLIITIITESELKRIEQIQQFNQVSAEQSKTSDHSIYEDEIKKALQSISIHIKKGQFQGQEISVWDLLQTSYITEEKRQELLGNYKLTVQDIITIVIKSVDEVENQNSSFKTEYKLNDDIYNNLKTVQVEISVGEYKGKKMLLWDLLMTSKYISEEKKVELFKKLNSGKLDTNELIKVIITIIEETEEKSKKLKFKGLRRQVTATELLTSEIIDQKTLTELTQGKKTVEEVTQMDTVKRYLEGTSCIAGVLVPSIKHPSKIEKMSIYDAKLKRVLRPGTALVLLEAQAATGFVIDPIKNKKLSVDEAVTASLVGQELHGKLLSAEKAVTGYKDPYTGDKISLFQAMQKDLIVKDHGIRLLEAQIATGGIIDPVHSHRVPVEVAYKRGYFDEEMNQILSDPSDDTKGFFDPNTHENLTYMQLLERCIKDPDTGLYMLDVKNSKPSYFQIDKKIESTLQSKTIHIKVGKYTGQNISIWELLNSQYLLEKRLDLLKKYQSGSVTIEELIQIIITIIEETENKTSFGDVNGSITDQSQQNKDAVQTTKQNQQTILQSHLVSITKGKLQGQKISVWDLLNSAYITEDKKHELLEKYTAGTLTLEDMIQIIITLISQTDEKTVTIEQKEFETTNTSLQLNISTHTDEQLKKALSAIKVSVQPGQFQEQRVSLWEVLNSKCIPANERDVQLKNHQTSVKELKQAITELVEVEEAKSDQEIQNALEKKTAEVAVGEFKGQSVSLWVLLHSKYVSEEKRKELLEKYKHGELTEEEILRIIIKIIEEIEERSRNLKFKGLRRQITATELLQSEIIDQSTMNELTQGSRTVEQVTQMDSVKRYLEGTSCIAGVFVTSKKDPSKREKINIYEAMLNRILRPGSALILLEAQAATGFVIDSKQNKKLSVDEALSAGLIGHEIYNKLLSAEKGVTGYTDPYSGEKISLFQAMQKDLIVKEHGIRLLEAQIATGGIIDPVHSHRVPVEVAYKRGYFDEEMSQILSDPSDDTKGFFDPNTHENLTYMQLLQRCIYDTETDLYMLDVNRSPSSFSQAEDKTNKNLQSKTIQITTGQFQGKNVSVWELLHSKYLSIEKQEELLKRYRSGALSIDELIGIITTIINDAEKVASVNQKVEVQKSLQSVQIDISVGSFKEKSMSVWDVINSEYIVEKEREELLEKFQSGTLTLEELIKIIITIITNIEKKTKHVTKPSQITVPEITITSHSVEDWPSDEQFQRALQVIPCDMSKQNEKESVSVWELLHNQNVSEDERQKLLLTCKHTAQEVMTICTNIIKTGEERDCPTENFAVDEQTQSSLKAKMVEVSSGELKGQLLSVWDLLHSKYISVEKSKDLLLAHILGTLTLDEMIKMIITILEESLEKSSQLKFKGLRRQVTATELLISEIIDQKTLTELTQGSKTLEEVTQMDSVKRYLEGTSCIAGVFVPAKQNPSKREKISIYQAMWKNILRPGTALVLLEAQAATGFIIDPINNKKLSVDEAVSAGVVGKELHAKLLSAERAVTGYNDPYTSKKISLFQAMKKNLIVKDHGIRLLEAQIATGGIIDPIHSHRVPVEVAYKRGYFDEEMSQILSDPTDDTKGFFDPNTHENLTYMQLLQRCMQDTETGLSMLEVKESKSSYFHIDQTIKNALQSKTVQYQGQNVSLWEIFNSQYVLEDEKVRQELLTQYKSGTLTIEQLMARIAEITEKSEHKSHSKIKSRVIKGHGHPHKHGIEQMEQSLQTQNLLKSVEVDITFGKHKGKKLSLLQLLDSKDITSEKKRELLEKYENGVLSLEELINYITELTMEKETRDKTVSRQDKTVKDGESTLDFLPEPIQKSLQSFYVPNSVGEFQQQNITLWEVLHYSNISNEKRQYLLTKYYSTIQEIISAITKLLQSTEKTSTLQIREDAAKFLMSVTVQVNTGEFKIEGKSHTLWELLHSKYITKEKRKELLEKFESKTLTWEEIFNIIVTIIKETEERGQKLKFKGLRRQVTASELLQSEIIDQNTLTELTQGKKTLAEVTEMDSVKRYLEGTSCIAGIIVQSKNDQSKTEKMSIYNAMLKRILRPGTALVLLEAQAATGFIIDPMKNTKLAVDEAVAARVIGQELYSKLLSAERAVTGYNDPTTGEKISLFQAMQKDLIVKDHGIRLLEAQIATGGIIDPVHSHRVPVDVAYKRGFFDEEMNQILSDPTDDTKGFFDPNTHENLTYMQLLQRCKQDPETGLCMLVVISK